MSKKILRYLKMFFLYSIHFSLFIAVKLILLPVLRLNQPDYERFAYKHKVIKKFLKTQYRKTINQFKGRTYTVDTSLADNYPVWTVWWQGESAMPPLVKTCYRTLQYYSNGHKINLITKDNVHKFVNIPDYILRKVEKEQISITHLADILRVCLLYEYGGLWLDSTVLLTEPIKPLPLICTHLGFWTPKDDGSILETCFNARNWIIREDKWLTFCFYASRYNILMKFVHDMFFAYLKSHTLFIDYFLFDYFISLCYDALPEVRVMIDSVPKNNPKVHELYHRLNPNFEYNKTLFDEICSHTTFHKLNWKDTQIEHTSHGKLTNYGYILRNFPPQ